MPFAPGLVGVLAGVLHFMAFMALHAMIIR